jgi:hypothetical protein
MLCALIQDNIVKEVVDLPSEDAINEQLKVHQFVNVIDDLDPKPVVGWMFDGFQYIDPNGSVPSKKITKLALLNRFTNNELAVYYAAVASNIGLAILDKKLFAAEYIDLTRPDTIYGINVLAGAGLITPQRASEILNNPIQEIEKYRGNR